MAMTFTLKYLPKNKLKLLSIITVIIELGINVRILIIGGLDGSLFPRHDEKHSSGRTENGVNQNYNRKGFLSQNSACVVSSGNQIMFCDSSNPGRVQGNIYKMDL